MTQRRVGILLGNTGTPKAATKRGVRSYLINYYSDKSVNHSNALVRFFKLRFSILPQVCDSATMKFSEVWTPQGSPFLTSHKKLATGLQEALRAQGYDVIVATGMCFGPWSMRSALRRLHKMKCDQIVMLPLHPLSSYSTTSFIIENFKSAYKPRWFRFDPVIINDYYRSPVFCKAIAASITKAGFGANEDDKLVFSYHSILLDDIERGDTYELQAGACSIEIASQLNIVRRAWTIGYQGAQGKHLSDWLSPLTADKLRTYGEQGAGHLYLVCPNFAVDCLDTLYDVPKEIIPAYYDAYRKTFGTTDGASITYVPSLNSTRAHVKVLVDVVSKYLDKD